MLYKLVQEIFCDAISGETAELKSCEIF